MQKAACNLFGTCTIGPESYVAFGDVASLTIVSSLQICTNP